LGQGYRSRPVDSQSIRRKAMSPFVSKLFVFIAMILVGAAAWLYFLRPSSKGPPALPAEVVVSKPLTGITESPAPVSVDSEKALAAFEGLPMGDLKRSEALGELASQLAAGDPVAALKWADGLDVPSERIRAFSIIMASVGDGDRTALAQAIEEMGINVSLVGLGSSHSAVSLLITSLLEEWGPEKAFDWVERNLTGDARRTNFGIIIAELARKNPAAAVDRIESMPNGPMRVDAISILASGWAYKDGLEALRFIESLSDDDVRLMALNRLAFHWVYDDEAAVVAQIEALPAGGEARDALLASLASHVAPESPGDAVGYANRIQGEARIAATRNLVRRWTEVDPEAAGKHVAMIDDATERERLAGVLLKAWLESEPRAAAAWAEDYEGEGAAGVTKDFMAQWMPRDPIAASSWLGTLEAGPKRDAAIKVLIIHESSNDPEGALRWAEAISDPDQRREQTSWLEKEIAEGR
jgi:hypothetical protein